MIHILDLRFLSHEHAIASFLIPTEDGLLLIESGPHSTYPQLETAIRGAGFDPDDIRHVLLTHIHFDHAGAAWALARRGARIYVHPFGAPHLVSPHKLYESARMIYGDDMDRLWGAMEPIPSDQIHPTEHLETLTIGGVRIQSLHTPGHARHHIAWQIDRVIFTGDIAGVRIDNGPVVPPCPPPDIHLEDWYDSIELLLSRDADTYYLTHFGPVSELQGHMSELKDRLEDWGQFVLEKWHSGLNVEAITPLFEAYTRQQLLDKGVSAESVHRYEAANPSWMSVSGLVRYWKKKQAAS